VPPVGPRLFRVILLCSRTLRERIVHYCRKVWRLLAVITRVNAERMILAWIIVGGAMALLLFVILHQG